MTDPTDTRLGKLAILVAVVAFLVCANALRNDLVYDAQFLVKSNGTFRQAALQESLGGQILALNDVFSESFWEGVNKTQTPTRQIVGQSLYRPLMLYVMGLVYVTVGDSALTYNLINALFHVLTSLLVLKVALLLTRNRRVAAIAALLFAAHPIHSEAIAYVAGLGETQSVMLMLTSMVLYLTAVTRDRLRIGVAVLSLIAFGAALFTKESAAILVVLLVLADLARGKSAPAWSRRLPLYVLFLAIILLNAWIRTEVCGRLTPDAAAIGRLDNPLSIEGFTARLATGVTLFVKGIQLFLLPIGQSSDYSFNQLPVARHLGEAAAWTSFLVCAVMTLIGVVTLRRWTALGFGLLAFLFSFGPVSNIFVVIGTIFGERLLYLPSLGLCLAAAALLDALLRRIEPLGDAAGKIARTVLWAGLIVLAVMTAVRNQAYRSIEVLYGDMVKTAPKSARAYYQRGEASRKKATEGYREELPLAAFDFRTAIDILPEFFPARIQLALVLSEEGKNEEALAVLQEAGTLLPDTPQNKSLKDDITRTRAMVVAKAGVGNDPVKAREILDEMVAMLEEHLRENPDDAGTAVQLGMLYLRLERVDEAQALAATHLLAHPDDDSLKALLIQAVFKKGDIEQGQRLLDGFGESSVADAQRTVDLYRCLQHITSAETAAREQHPDVAQDEWRQAVTGLSEFVEKYPEEAEGFYYRGYALHDGFDGRLEDALADYLRCVQLNPSHPDVFYRIGQVLIGRGDFTQDERTLAFFEQLKTMYTDNGHFQLGYGRVLGGYGRHEAAAEAYARAIELGFNGAMSHALLAKELIEAGHEEQAIELLESAEKEIPELRSPLVIEQKGVALLALDRYVDAAREFELALKLAAQDPAYGGQMLQLRFQVAKTQLRVEGKASEGYRALTEMLEQLDRIEESPPAGIGKADLKTLREMQVYVYRQLGWAYANVPSLLDRKVAREMLEKAISLAEELQMKAALENDLLPDLEQL